MANREKAAKVIEGRDSGDDLVQAAKEGNLPVVLAFIALGLPLNAVTSDVNRQTPLFHASCCNHRSIVAALVLAHASVDVVDAFGNTPLLISAANGQVEVCKRLIEGGKCKSINKADGAGNTPLKWAVANNKTEVIAPKVQRRQRITRTL